MDLLLLQNMSVILITAVVILLIFNKLKLPSMIGLFLTGIVLGRFITSTDIITSVSELGVIFLLFIIGLEFSIEKFSAIKDYAVIGGILQVILTTIFVSILTFIAGAPLNSAVFMGFLICFSSTAIVMKLIQKKHLNHTVTGRVTLGILIFQDIAVIIVLLLTPLLGGEAVNLNTLPTVGLKFMVLVAILLIMGLRIIPRALHEAARTKNRDLFMLLILFICLGTTYATTSVGISPELGAFIAGLIISNTEYSHQTLSYVQPFQDVFMSIFLISIGLMINVEYFAYNIVLILVLACIVLFVKFVATFITGHVLRIPIKTTIAISILISQIGEFSFVLANEGIKYGLLSSDVFTMFLAVSIITMSSTPFLEKLTPRVVDLFKRFSYFQVDDELQTIADDEIPVDVLEDHVIIVGFGVNGKNLSRSCRNYNIPYVVVDANPMIVKKEKELGIPIIYGNASNESVLKELGVYDAKCIVIATSAYDSTIKAVDTARRMNPDIHIIVRTRYIKNVREVYDAGADEVVPEEFETAIVIFTRVMDYYNKDLDEINDTVDVLRSNTYETFRSSSPEEITNNVNELSPNWNVDSIYVNEKSKLEDYKFKDYNLTVTSIIRGDKSIIGMHHKFELEVDDCILFTGTPRNIDLFKEDYYLNVS